VRAPRIGPAAQDGGLGLAMPAAEALPFQHPGTPMTSDSPHPARSRLPARDRLIETELGTPTAEPELDPTLTAPNAVTGTPAYLSPESALGEPVDQRTDIYALGCVAYWLLTGQYVFTGATSMQLMARHVSSAPVPPSRHSAFEVSPALDEVVLGCLRKKPADRPASARELCDLLGQCVEQPWTREDARLWWETRLEPEPLVSLAD
jgi:serine/threonine protein kinase